MYVPFALCGEMRNFVRSMEIIHIGIMKSKVGINMFVSNLMVFPFQIFIFPFISKFSMFNSASFTHMLLQDLGPKFK